MNRVKVGVRSIFERWKVLLHDIAMIPLAWFGAYWVRYNLDSIPQTFLDSATGLLPIVIIIQILCFIAFRTYKGLWRFTAPLDLWRVSQAVVLGTTLIALCIFFVTRLVYVPRTIFIFYAIGLLLGLCITRILFRYYKEHSFVTTDNAQKALIVGAGHAAEQVVRDLLKVKPRVYTPVAFVDDDVNKVGQQIRGISVAGTCDDIPVMAEKWPLDIIIIAVPSASDEQMQRIVSICETTKVKFRTLPAIQDIVSGRAGLGELREVRIEDLLGRDQISMHNEQVSRYIRGKTVLITGGGGSIGSELCRQVSLSMPEKLVIFDQSEFNLYTIEKELRERFGFNNVVPVIGDVCDEMAIEKVFKTYQPHLVYHAAAYKHVPLLQSQIREAAKNNILGTYLMATASNHYGVEKFVLISTDKAVNPSNWMGVTKRSAEVLCQNISLKSQTKFDIVRFGNVLGSAGSVVPRFRRQIEDGGPVTVTHPDMTRYFMTIKEATQLILEASSMSDYTDSNIYVLDMGSPIKITFLAEQMIRLSGYKPGVDIQITYTGLRPGEKLYEELFYPQEKLLDTDNKKIFKAQHRNISHPKIDEILTKLLFAIRQYNESEIIDCLQLIVPETLVSASQALPLSEDDSD